MWVYIALWLLGILIGRLLQEYKHRKDEKPPIGTIIVAKDSVDGEIYMFLEMDISKEEFLTLGESEAIVRIAQKIQ